MTNNWDMRVVDYMIHTMNFFSENFVDLIFMIKLLGNIRENDFLF